MPELSQFSTPAQQVDFPNDPQAQAALDATWSTNVDGFTEQAITGNPWTETYASNQTWYYNPLTTDIPSTAASVLVSWFSFPNRLNQYFGAGASPPNPYNYSQAQLLEAADTGMVNGQPLPQIPTQRCPEPDWTGTLEDFGPYGPRGWQDEYCEWSVVRNAQGKITRVDFACENPEYWYTLWRQSRQTVAQLYQDTLNHGAPPEQAITVTVEDLQLVDPTTGKPVIDPATGHPAYNPLNKWNFGTVSTRSGSPSDSGGVMHLTATPNTLQTEVGEAAAGTVSRVNPPGNSNPQLFICCGQFGQNFRNSDPHIGQTVNLVVSTPPGYQVSLADPVGLYIQMPDFSTYALPSDPNLPSGAQPSDCWQIVRGSQLLTDPVTNQPFPGSFILHAAFQIPEAWIDAGVSFTVGDITIGGQPIQWASQISQTLQIGLFARPIPATLPELQPCVGTPSPQYAQPLQSMYSVLWDAYYGTAVKNPQGYQMSLASNTVIIPPVIQQGATDVQLALTCSAVTLGPNGELPQVVFPPGEDITATAVRIADVYYAVPGNS
jgi:hypothetical protein